jgi:hypothetical protein
MTTTKSKMSNLNKTSQYYKVSIRPNKSDFWNLDEYTCYYGLSENIVDHLKYIKGHLDDEISLHQLSVSVLSEEGNVYAVYQRAERSGYADHPLGCIQCSDDMHQLIYKSNIPRPSNVYTRKLTLIRVDALLPDTIIATIKHLEHIIETNKHQLIQSTTMLKEANETIDKVTKHLKVLQQEVIKT